MPIASKGGGAALEVAWIERSDRLPPAPQGAPPPMDLLEYQGKQLFAKHGVAVPSGEVAATVDDAVAAAERIGYPCAIKAQVLIGGRGKAGGIKIAQDTEEARAYANAILGMDIVGPHGEGPFRVDQVWIEGGSDIASEYYASVILDRGEKKLLAMVSAKGGMDIEAVAAEDPEALVKVHIDPTRPFDAAAARPIVDAAGLDEDVRGQAAEVLVKLAEVASAEDANLIEVNPLIVTNDREVVALDAKVTIDGNALFRHQDLAEIADTAEDPQEAMAKEKGLTYVKLDGNVGILANGAGLCMSTLDVVAQAGGAPANFLDAGGGSKAEAIVDALTVITSDQKVTAILFNIFGGITRCDEIANGIVTASREMDLKLPLVVRLDGTNSEQGLAILAEADLPNLRQETTMLGAAKRVVELAGASG
jgi:succinyl-CoA synthetase beta subunit